MKKYIIALSLAVFSLSMAACEYTQPTTPPATVTTPTAPPSTVPSTQPTKPILTGWQVLDGKTCYFDGQGIRQTGWLELEDGLYYLDDQGILQTGWLELEDGRYFQTEYGIVQKCWLTLPEGRYYLTESGTPLTGWQNLGGKDVYFLESGVLANGLVSIEDVTYYFTPDGTLTSGWVTLGTESYYLNENGSIHTGWLEVDADRYYFREDGRMARGMVMVSETEARYFTASGKEIVLVNPWNYIPEDYDPDLVKYNSRYQISSVMLAPLKQMLADCKASGATAIVGSAYRTHEYQEGLFENKIQRVMKSEGCSREEAMIIAATVVAIPGTSEHQLGLAVDLVDITYQLLNEEQEKTAAQKWLMEHCWEYGFILRYPNDKSDSTGIIYEPWHYRYVGVELSMELRDLGLSLEEYLDMLTEK